jgi:FkbM family methyltransferase
MEPLFAFPPVFETRDCRYGRMLYPAQDLYVGRSLALYGEYSEWEADVLRHFVRPRDAVVEVGANLGAHTVLLARLAGAAGSVLAFEPQPVIYQLLCANLALNQITTVQAEPKGLGRRTGFAHIPVLDYGARENFGGLSLELVTEGVKVPVAILDSYRLSRCDFLKLDVEGMELQVLEGGAETLHRLRPVLYVENDRQDKSHDLMAFLLAMDYRLWWHWPALFHPDNFAGNPENVFGQEGSVNLLCVPREKGFSTNMVEVKGPGDWWQP